MQFIFDNEDERSYSKRTGIVGVNICIRRVRRYMERKCNGRVGSRSIGVWEFLDVIRKEFGGGDDESKKVAELKELEQGEKMIQEFV